MWLDLFSQQFIVTLNIKGTLQVVFTVGRVNKCMLCWGKQQNLFGALIAGAGLKQGDKHFHILMEQWLQSGPLLLRMDRKITQEPEQEPEDEGAVHRAACRGQGSQPNLGCLLASQDNYMVLFILWGPHCEPRTSVSLSVIYVIHFHSYCKYPPRFLALNKGRCSSTLLELP